MPTLYILCGLPYSGKSLFSREIERTTFIKRISFDDTWDELRRKNKDATYEMVLYEIEKELTENLEKGVSVMYDSINLSAEHRNKLAKLAENAGAQSKIIYLQISNEELYKRRAQSLIDNTHQNVLSDKEIDNAVNRFEEPDDCIRISTEEEKKNFLDSLNTI
jgi:predicted kinase